MKRAFVTGGSGFLGGRLIPALRAGGIDVTALARSAASAAAVTALGATPARGDLENLPSLAGYDVIFHCAAHTDQWDPVDVHMRINLEGTKHVLAAAGTARVIHVGTEAVLADGHPIIRADETRPLPAKAMGAYPLTKGLAEQAAVAAGAVVVRPRFIWGRGDTSVLPEIVAQVRAGKFAWIGGGHYLTSTCHVDNVVEGMLLAAERGQPGQIYFLTDGAPVDFRDFMTKLLATQGVDAGSRSLPRWLVRATVALTSWMKRPPITRTAFALIAHEVTVDDSKARRELGYTGGKSIEAGLAEMRG